MSKDLKRIVTVAVVLVGATAFGGALYKGWQEAEQAKQIDQTAQQEPSIFERPHSRSKGPKTAPVTLVEFFDPECESCRAVYPLVMQLMSEYGNSLRVVMRYMPLHKNARYAASVLEAAGDQGLYWETLEALLRFQPEWGDHHNPQPERIPQYAEQVGVDVKAMEEAIQSGRYADRIEMDYQDGIKLGVRQTPTFFVNGKLVAQLGYAPLKHLIDQALTP